MLDLVRLEYEIPPSIGNEIVISTGGRNLP